jgi:hypothetical protein
MAWTTEQLAEAERRHDLLVAAKLDELKRDARVFVQFDGNESCSDLCLGWNGVSHRCDCGNRRMEWDTEYGYATPYCY